MYVEATWHPHKWFPEIDFVICGPEGLYVIEIEGGSIACDDGVWQYRDRYGRSTPAPARRSSPSDSRGAGLKPACVWPWFVGRPGYGTASRPGSRCPD